MGDDTCRRRAGLDFTATDWELSCVPQMADLGVAVNKVEPPANGYIRTAA
jgi:hypothetical protein